jgi:hypothetical protein
MDLTQTERNGAPVIDEDETIQSFRSKVSSLINYAERLSPKIREFSLKKSTETFEPDYRVSYLQSQMVRIPGICDTLLTKLNRYIPMLTTQFGITEDLEIFRAQAGAIKSIAEQEQSQISEINFPSKQVFQAPISMGSLIRDIEQINSSEYLPSIYEGYLKLEEEIFKLVKQIYEISDAWISYLRQFEQFLNRMKLGIDNIKRAVDNFITDHQIEAIIHRNPQINSARFKSWMISIRKVLTMNVFLPEVNLSIPAVTQLQNPFIRLPSSKTELFSFPYPNFSTDFSIFSEELFRFSQERSEKIEKMFKTMRSRFESKYARTLKNPI